MDRRYTEAENKELLRKMQLRKEIKRLKMKLADTDYIIIKGVEGLVETGVLEQWMQRRAAWRTQINELERQL